MYDPEFNGDPELQPPENCQVKLGLVPVGAVNSVVVLLTLLSKTFLVKLSTCTVQPVLRLVPCKPLLPLVQVSAGVAGRLVALQVDAPTALLVKHMVSPVATAFAVITSPLIKLILFKVHVVPVPTFETVPADIPFLYTVMVAVAAAPVSTDFAQVPLIFTVPVPNGALTKGAAVHIFVAQLETVLNIGQEGCPFIKSS